MCHINSNISFLFYISYRSMYNSLYISIYIILYHFLCLVCAHAKRFSLIELIYTANYMQTYMYSTISFYLCMPCALSRGNELTYQLPPPPPPSLLFCYARKLFVLELTKTDDKFFFFPLLFCLSCLFVCVYMCACVCVYPGVLCCHFQFLQNYRQYEIMHNKKQ